MHTCMYGNVRPRIEICSLFHAHVETLRSSPLPPVPRLHCKTWQPAWTRVPWLSMGGVGVVSADSSSDQRRLFCEVPTYFPIRSTGWNFVRWQHRQQWRRYGFGWHCNISIQRICSHHVTMVTCYQKLISPAFTIFLRPSADHMMWRRTGTPALRDKPWELRGSYVCI